MKPIEIDWKFYETDRAVANTATLIADLAVRVRAIEAALTSLQHFLPTPLPPDED
jgi:hypothetical protein